MYKTIESSISTFFRLPAPAALAPVRKADSLPRRRTVKAIAAAIEAAGLGEASVPEWDQNGERAVHMDGKIGPYHFGIAEHVMDRRVVGYIAGDEYRNFRVSGRGVPLTLDEAVGALVELVASERQHRAEMAEADMT